jgi:large subunit ribosomal protein L10
MIKKTKNKEETKKRIVSPQKVKAMKELISTIESHNTIIVSSIVNLPSKQLQKIRHKLRKEFTMQIIKKKAAIKALQEAKKENVDKLSPYIETNCAILFSDLDPFEIAGLLVENKYPVKAKPGQIAEEDILIEAGPTDLMPGPAISELSAVGLKTGVEGGKISIKIAKVIVEKGKTIEKKHADVLMKLGILPFTIGLEIKAAYDSKDKKIYTNIKIDKEGFKNQLTSAFASARQFAINLGYACKETIMAILEKAQREAISLEKAVQSASQESQSSAPTEENK